MFYILPHHIISLELEFNYNMKAIFQNALGKVKANPEPKIKDPVLSNPNEEPASNLDVALDDMVAMKNKKSSFKREEVAHPYKSVLTEQKKNSLKEKFGSRLHMKDENNWSHDKDPHTSQSGEQYMLFVRNLPADSTIIDIKNLFDKFGLIKGVKVRM
jgi:RNA recognition motif-containing protein